MYYNDFGTWIRKQFPDFRVQKISIDAGFSCPNRDGRISSGGCTYCDNRTFNPSYCDRKKSITEHDIDTRGASARGAKRIVFSNDGLIYYTDDHYNTFTLLYGNEN